MSPDPDPGVEVQQEQVVDERGVEPLQPRPELLVHRHGRLGQLSHHVAVVGVDHSPGVDGLAGAVTPEPAGGPVPEVQDRVGGIGRVERRVELREDLAAHQEEVGDRPQVHRVDLGARPPAGGTDLLRRHGGVDGPHHLRVADERLAARHQDVRRHRDELALVAGPLRRQPVRDRAVVRDQLVGPEPPLVGRGAGRLRHGPPPARRSSRAPPRCRPPGPGPVRTPSRTAPGTHG